MDAAAFVAVWGRTHPDVAGVVAQQLQMALPDARLRTAGNLPRVVQRTEALVQAHQTAQQLKDAGVPALAFTRADVERWPLVTVRTFHFDADQVVGVQRNGMTQAVLFTDVRGIFKARMQQQGVDENSSTSRKFSLGKAVLTGGIAVSKKVTTTTKTSTYAAWHMVLVAGAQGALVFDEQETQFAGLPPPLPPSRFACVGALEARVKGTAPHAVCSDALMHPEQIHNDATMVLGEQAAGPIHLGAWLMSCFLV